MTALLVISYCIIKDGNEQLNRLNDDDNDDPTVTCWDDNKAHTEDKF